MVEGVKERENWNVRVVWFELVRMTCCRYNNKIVIKIKVRQKELISEKQRGIRSPHTHP